MARGRSQRSPEATPHGQACVGAASREHGFTGGYTIVKDYIREGERRGREMFAPLAHPPGHAQSDFGEAVVIICVGQKARFFVMDLPQSDACFVRAYGMHGKQDNFIHACHC